MAWPPPVLPINRTNATPQQNTHPNDHNTTNQAINDLVTKVTELVAYKPDVGRVTGGGGNYPAGTGFLHVDIPVRSFPRLLSFTYMGLVSAQPSQTLDIAGTLDLATIVQFRVTPASQATLITETVTLSAEGIVLSAGAAHRVDVYNVGGTISLVADATFNSLFWSAIPNPA